MNDPDEYLDRDDLIDLAHMLLGNPPPICDVDVPWPDLRPLAERPVVPGVSL